MVRNLTIRFLRSYVLAEKNTSDKLDVIDWGLREMLYLHKNLISGFRPGIGPPGLNRTHWRALMHIADSGSDCMKGIGRHVGLEAGSFTPVADRLIEEGLMERFTDPSDRRRVLLRITEAGTGMVKDLKALMKRHFSRNLSVLNNRQLGDLAEAMSTISEINCILRGNNNE